MGRLAAGNGHVQGSGLAIQGPFCANQTSWLAERITQSPPRSDTWKTRAHVSGQYLNILSTLDRNTFQENPP